MTFNIVPQPRKIKVINEKMTSFKEIKLSENDMTESAVKDFTSFADFGESKKVNILFEKDENINEEGYRLVVKNGLITISSSTPSGSFYALQTLKQLLHQGKMELPELEIDDYPSYSYRGFMLDVGRYFYSVSDVKLLIDRMVLHKMNRFHFHLTEDQGWRVQIDKYPLLTEIGSMRSHTNFNHKAHGGFYTKDEIRDIVDYCHQRYIKVMPEFDVPGHCRAAIAAYPDLMCFPRELEVATHWGVKRDVLCAGKEISYKFVYDVIDELCELFPDKIFHIGGDEVFKHRWDHCPNCQKKIKEENLKDSGELQEYFMNKIYDHLENKGYQVFMWNYQGLNPTVLNRNIGYTLCGNDSDGRVCIDTSTSAYYLDLAYGYIPLDNCCNHKIHKDAIGAEIQIWGEYIPNMKKLDSMVFPRVAGMIENAWSGGVTPEALNSKLESYYSFLDLFKINYSSGKSKLNPKKFRKKMSILWFERRQLHWEGLTVLLQNKQIERIVEKMNK